MSRKVVLRFETESSHDLLGVLTMALLNGDMEAMSEARAYLVDITEVPRVAEMGLFATPESTDDLQRYVVNIPDDSERAVGVTVFGMTWNLMCKFING